MALSISSLTLTNFRNHADFSLVHDGACVVLTGPNGSGKTNVLEAISLFIPGRGMCRATPDEWQNRNNNAPWAVRADFKTVLGVTHIATGCDQQDQSRVLLIDGQSVKSQQALLDYVAMAWITPQMDRILVEGPAARRRLLDRMIFSFDAAHAGRVHRYEKAMRERLSLLRQNCQDKSWFSGLEDDMARTGVAIAVARLQLIESLQKAIEEAHSAFPRAVLRLQGALEDRLAVSPALLVEDWLRGALAESRFQDMQTQTCSVGAHRSDLVVTHDAQGVRADLCSTGEQKALLVAVILAYARLLENARGMKPLLLLDDITAHLDQTRRRALFEEITFLGVQAWLTGTDVAVFEPFLAQAFHCVLGKTEKEALCVAL
ncbi:MAG: DNA replication/repair protein RecF [Alphaproteobacteria bacterium]|nr:DNA replication/repair protein RecF [Alphaproteobacteria bacterium]